MKALCFNGGLYLQERPLPVPRPHEALVKVKATGICTTDLEILKGYMDFKGIPGHEFAGVVTQCKDKNLLNKNVVGEINIACGSCTSCLLGHKRHCPQRTVLGIFKKDGAMAEYLTLPMDNLHVLPDDIEFTTAAFIEPLAAACEILEQVHIKPEHSILVIGDGRLGALIAQVLNLFNPRVTVLGKNPFKLQTLTDLKLNACSHIENSSLWDIIVECTGNPSGFAIALQHCKPRGIIVLKSTYHSHSEIDQNTIVINELTLIGSRCGNFQTAINLLKNGLVNVKVLITKTLPLTHYQEAFAQAQEPNTFKIIIQF